MIVDYDEGELYGSPALLIEGDCLIFVGPGSLGYARGLLGPAGRNWVAVVIRDESGTDS